LAGGSQYAIGGEPRIFAWAHDLFRKPVSIPDRCLGELLGIMRWLLIGAGCSRRQEIVNVGDVEPQT
jgi:hypothetical protein